MEYTITSNHAWFSKQTKLVLLVENDVIKERKWINNDQVLKLDYHEDLNNLFSLSGLGPSELITNMNIELFYKLIYAIEIPKDHLFVNISTCGCNMGHCYSPTAYKKLNCKTIGELFSHMGYESNFKSQPSQPSPIPSFESYIKKLKGTYEYGCEMKTIIQTEEMTYDEYQALVLEKQRNLYNKVYKLDEYVPINVNYFEYPDSMFVSISKTEVPKEFHNKTCNGSLRKLEEDFSDKQVYTIECGR